MNPALTTNQGVTLSDNQNSLRANPHGPTLLEDFILREKITHFDPERIPERVVHARATGAHGFFELTPSLHPYTTARVLTEVGEKTPVFTRTSTVAGGAGSGDTARDVRGFAVKFYTKEGNWDLVGNNIPVFFIQDAIKFPDLIHVRNPDEVGALTAKGEALLLTRDVTDQEQIAAAIKTAEERCDRLGVLVTHAGIGELRPVKNGKKTTGAEWFEINVFGLSRMIHATLSGMRKRRQGFIGNGSSIGGLRSLSAARSQTGRAETSVRNEADSSGVAWAAVIGGAFVAAALSLILLALGAGLGLSSVSPWSTVGASASTVSTAAIVWLILMQVRSSPMGGYLAGRLRTKWANIHTDEVYFRDTAHGVLAWAVALVVTARRS